LIQDRSLARNIDSKNVAPGFDCCRALHVADFIDSIGQKRLSDRSTPKSALQARADSPDRIG
jgi:hypothetical protein